MERDYHDDPLWKLAVEKQKQACKEVESFADLYGHFKGNEVLADVLLAYFDGKKLREFQKFVAQVNAHADELQSRGYRPNDIISYQYKPSVDVEMYQSEAEALVDRMLLEKADNLAKAAQGAKNSKNPLDGFKCFLNF